MAGTGIITTYPLLNLAMPDIGDPTSVAIADLSVYGGPVPTTYSLQITPPTFPTINAAFNPGEVNIYKCSDLGITCALTNCCPLPDGIFDIIYTVVQGTQNVVLEKSFLRTAEIRCKWMKAFAKVDLDCHCKDYEQRQYKEELKKIDLLINGSVAAANNCDPVLAFNLYQKANNMLNLIACKFGLPCGTKFTCNPCQSCK